MEKIKPKISVIAVNWYASDFAKLLVNSVKSNCKNIDDIEIILIDNSGELDIDGVKIVKSPRNLGHGYGLDTAVALADSEYILILDIDAHILLKDWDTKLVEELEKTKSSMICAQGNEIKPIRPLFMFFKKETVNGMSFKSLQFEGINFDVVIPLYFRVLTKYGHKSVLMLPYRKTDYKDVFGNEYSFNGERIVYHNWYGTRWFGKGGVIEHKVIDNREYEDFKIKKENLFKQL